MPFSAEPAAKTAKPKAGADAKPKAASEHLKPGQLDGLVLAYLKKNADSGPHGPTAVARALDRSSGAVGNCLVRLTKAKQVRQDSDKPRRYSLAASAATVRAPLTSPRSAGRARGLARDDWRRTAYHSSQPDNRARGVAVYSGVGSARAVAIICTQVSTSA